MNLYWYNGKLSCAPSIMSSFAHETCLTSFFRSLIFFGHGRKSKVLWHNHTFGTERHSSSIHICVNTNLPLTQCICTDTNSVLFFTTLTDISWFLAVDLSSIFLTIIPAMNSKFSRTGLTRPRYSRSYNKHVSGDVEYEHNAGTAPSDAYKQLEMKLIQPFSHICHAFT